MNMTWLQDLGAALHACFLQIWGSKVFHSDLCRLFSHQHLNPTHHDNTHAMPQIFQVELSTKE